MAEKENGSDFVKETIKEKPKKIKKTVTMVIIIIAAAAAAAIVACLVFVSFMPVALQAFGYTKQTQKVTIISNDSSIAVKSVSPTETPEVTPEVTPQAVTESSSKEDKTKTSSHVTQEEDASNSGRILKKAETKTKEPVTVEDYYTVCDEMNSNIEEAERAIVTVTGIISSEDFFLQPFDKLEQLSGVVIAQSDDYLYVITSYHILENVDRIQVTFSNGQVADAIFVRNDPQTNISVIKVDVSDFNENTLQAVKTIELGKSQDLKKGDPLFAVGTIGEVADSRYFGFVTSLSEISDNEDHQYPLISTDITAGKNDSGAVLDPDGKLIGLIVNENGQKTDLLKAYQSTEIMPLIEKLSNNEARPRFGIRGTDITQAVSAQTGVPKGVLITEVSDDSPAMLSGLSEYDVICEINDENIESFEDFERVLDTCTVGKTAKVNARRKGVEGYSEVKFDVTIGEV